MSKILITSFANPDVQHGGYKRSSQLREEFFALGYQILHLDNPRKCFHDLILHNFFLLIKNLFKWYVLTLNKKLRYAGLLRLVVAACWLERLQVKYQIETVALDVTCGINMFFGKVLKHHNIPYICFPHNIEFLVPGQHNMFFKTSLSAIDWELDLYRSAKHIFAISKFDCAILKCFSFNVSLFEYYPVKSECDLFNEVCVARQSCSKDYYLLVGTVHNTPTLLGMNSFLEKFLISNIQIKIVVVGYGAEIFKQIKDERVIIRGAVSNNELFQLYKNAKCAIITQVQTSGFLTKIIEFNLCNIPMFCMSQYVQAENLYKYGVICVNAIDDLYYKSDTCNFIKFDKPNLGVVLEYANQ